MPAPRKTIDSLVNQLKLEKRRTCIVTEGVSDRRLLEGYVDAHNLPVDIYCADDIEIKTDEQFKKYGGAKGRVITLLANDDISPYADKNAAGLVDRDLDEELNQLIGINGIYYTEYACLTSYLMSTNTINSWLKTVFGQDFSYDATKELERYIIQNYKLRVVKAKCFPKSSLPNIKNYVRPMSQGGFDWHHYIQAYTNNAGPDASEKAILSRMDNIEARLDQRFYVHFHSIIEFVYFFARKERIFDNSVTEYELYRNMPLLYTSSRNECGTAKWLHNFTIRFLEKGKN